MAVGRMVMFVFCVCGVDGLVEEGSRNFQKCPEVNVVIVVGREGLFC